MIPLLMKVFINVGDEERKKIALFQILVLVAKIPPYCKQQLLRQKYYFFWIVPSLYFRCAALEVSESFHHVVRTPHCDLCYEALEKIKHLGFRERLAFFRLKHHAEKESDQVLVRWGFSYLDAP